MFKKVTRGFEEWWVEKAETENIFQLPTIFSAENKDVDDYLDMVIDIMKANDDWFKMTDDVREWTIRQMPQDLPKNDSIVSYWAVLLVCHDLAERMVENW